MARNLLMKIICDNGKCQSWVEIDVTSSSLNGVFDSALDRYIDRVYWHCDDNGDDWCPDCWGEKLRNEEISILKKRVLKKRIHES